MAKERTAEQQAMIDGMDAAAAQAAEILKDVMANQVSTARDVAAWWAAWYPKAGHKRLGRLLAQVK
jgi:hypothetical protein